MLRGAKVVPMSKGGRIPLVDDGDLDDEYPTYVPLSLIMRF